MRSETTWHGSSGGRTGRAGRGGRRASLAALAVCSLLAGALAVPAGAFAQSTAVLAWGDNDRFDLGAGYRDTAGNASPATVPGLSSVESVLAAGSTSYALVEGGAVRAWGGGVKGQLGDGVSRAADESLPAASARTPVTVLEQNGAGERHELTHVKQLAASYGSYVHALALVENAEHETEVVTWGASEYGERGNGEYGFVKPKEEESHAIDPREVAMATTGLKHVVYVAAGGASSFAITEEGGVTKAWAWGDDQGGRLGVESSVEPQECRGEGGVQDCITHPTKIALPALPEGVRVTAIYGGRDATYARLSNGQLLAWGANDHGQLGNGLAPTASSTPVYVCAIGATAPCSAHLEGVKEVAGGAMSAVALTEAGTVVGWGSNGDGELGGTAAEECKKTIKACVKSPKVVEGLEHIAQISEAPNTTVALTESGTVYSLGLNEHGQLGDGSLVGPEECAAEQQCSRSPVAVAGLSEVGGISAGVSEIGEGHTLAWLKSGSGPAPLLTVTPGHGSLKLTWTFSDEEFKVSYRLAPEFVKPGENWKLWEHGPRTCSVSSPCTATITGLKAEQYSVKIDSTSKVEGKLKVDDTHIAYGTPEP